MTGLLHRHLNHQFRMNLKVLRLKVRKRFLVSSLRFSFFSSQSSIYLLNKIRSRVLFRILARLGELCTLQMTMSSNFMRKIMLKIIKTNNSEFSTSMLSLSWQEMKTLRTSSIFNTWCQGMTTLVSHFKDILLI